MLIFHVAILVLFASVQAQVDRALGIGKVLNNTAKRLDKAERAVYRRFEQPFSFDQGDQGFRIDTEVQAEPQTSVNGTVGGGPVTNASAYVKLEAVNFGIFE